MPAGQPQVGEVWEMLDGTGRSVRGVVSDISPTILTLVSFTGNRFRTTPSRLDITWRFSQPPPPTALRCNRRGCGQPGIMRFQRGMSPEWVCPRHLPVGVQATLTTESLGVPQTPQAPEQVLSRCPGCTLEVEPIEDARCSTDIITFWQCPACNARWGAWSLTPEWGARDERTASFIREVLTAYSEHLRALHVTISQIDALPGVIEMLLRSPHLEETLPSTIPQMYSFLGFNLRPNFDLPDTTPIIIRVTGAPIVRAVAPTVNERGWRLLPQAPRPTIEQTAAQLAHALRMDRELRPDRDRPLRPGEIAIVGDTEYVGRFPIRREIQIEPLVEPFAPASPDETALMTAMAPTPYAAVGQRWVNRSTGDLVEVTRVRLTDDRSTQAVHFRRVADGIESSHALVLEDFLRECRPYVAKSSAPVQVPVAQVIKDEEWEHIDSGEVVTIDTVDTRRDLVIVQQKEGKRRSVPLYEFANAKWRKIVRRTSFDRLLDLEDD